MLQHKEMVQSAAKVWSVLHVHISVSVCCKAHVLLMCFSVKIHVRLASTASTYKKA